MRVDESYKISEKCINSLLALYRYESRWVNSGLNVGKDFSIEWSKDDLIEVVEESGGTEDEAMKLLSELKDTKRIVIFYSENGEERAYRTDTAELVRLSSFNYNRYPESKTEQMVTTQCGVTWDIESKMTPQWSITINEVATQLRAEISEGWIDDTGVIQNYTHRELDNAVTLVCAAYSAVQMKKFGNGGSLSGFQFRSARAMLRGIYSTGNKTLAILAGTGSGKSYGFQIGSLISIVEQLLTGNLEKTHSIFLYPRVALMDDQRKSMEELLDCCNNLLPSDKKIRWVTDGGSYLKQDYRRIIDPSLDDKSLKKTGIQKVISKIYADRTKCPHLVFANADTLTNRLTSHDAVVGLTSELKNVVFDEIHLLESITGANTSGVIRRLCAQANHELMLTGSSATIADEQNHLGKVFARKENQVAVVKPAEEELELTGIIHHVFHRAMDGSSFKTNLVNLTSLITHVRRRRKTSPVESPNESHKTIGFADSLNLIGSWEFMLRDNEGLEFRPDVIRKLKQGLDVTKLKPESMPLPYRFDKPLVHLSKMLEELSEKETATHCNTCIEGGQSQLKIPDASVFNQLPLDPFRDGSIGYLDGLYDGPKTIGVTDQCPYFECGACWREEKDFSPLQLYPDGPIVYSNSMHPIRLTSQSIQEKKQHIEFGGELEHFSVKKDEYHNLQDEIKKFGKQIVPNEHVAEIALSSPAIEVGMDFDNAIDAVMFKAIRNVSAYRQKVGRLGRERFRDVYSSMLTSFRAVDFHYYRNPAPLLSNDRLDPIPLNVDNEAVRKQIAYMAVYDDIARHGGKVAQDLHSLASHDRYSTVVLAALEYLNKENKSIVRRLTKGLKEAKGKICEEAIDNVKAHLGLLVLDISSLLQGDAVCLADRIGKKGSIPNSYYSKGMQKLILTKDGTDFKEACITINDFLKKLAINRHHDNEKSEKITELIKKAIDIWDCFEKGKNDSRICGLFEEIDFRLVTEAMESLGGNNPLIMILMEGSQCKSSLEQKSEVVQNAINSGEIPLGLTFVDWEKERGKSSNQFSIYYLRNLFSALQFTKHCLPFVFQNTLFKPPNEKTVAVYVPKPSGQVASEFDQNTVDLPIKEVLFAHAPGMWNYRRASMPMKTSCYKQLQPSEFNHMFMPLNNSGGDEIKHSFVKRGKIQRKDLPWNFIQNNEQEQIALFEPEKIQLRISRGLKRGNEVIKGKAFNEAFTLIKDNDDTDEENFVPDEGVGSGDGEESEEKEKNNINVPECYPIGWRKIEALSSEEVFSFSGPFEVRFERDILREILFENTSYSNQVIAKEYILGITRKYQGGGELEIQYVDDKQSQRNSVIGHEYSTHGMKFDVNKNTLKIAENWTSDQMVNEIGHHTIYQVLHHIVSKKLKVNRFVVDSLIKLVLFKRKYVIPNQLSVWLNEIDELTISDFKAFKVAWEMSSMRGIKLDALEVLVVRIQSDPGKVLENSKMLTKDWAVRTYSNSIAIHMLQAAREFTGSRDDDLGYHVECENGLIDSDSNITIWLYDRSPDGNGTTQTLKKWFQIPKIVKDEFENTAFRNLPSQDYIDCLEGSYLNPCSAHQSDAIAYACYEHNKNPEELHHNLKREFLFSYTNYSEYWKRLEEEHNYSKHEYPFVELIIPLIYSNVSLQESFKKAVSGCHSSCIECLEEFGISMFGPLDGPHYANKRMISFVISESMKKNSDDYRQTEVSIQGAAEGLDGIGSYDPSKPLYVDIDGKRVERFAMLHPVRRWSEVNTSEPFGKEGQIQSTFWTKMKIDRWSDG